MTNPNFNQEVVNDYYAPEAANGESLFGNEISGRVRFESITRQFEFDGATVLDIGCGYGDLLDHMNREMTMPADYLGIDPFDKVIDVAKEKHPDSSFICADYLEWDTGRFDYNVLVSVFDRKFGNIPDSKAYAWKVIEKAIREARIGTAITFLSTYKTINDPGELLFDPAEVMGFARQLTERVMIDYSYAPQAFTLFTWNEPSEFRQAWEKQGAWK